MDKDSKIVKLKLDLIFKKVFGTEEKEIAQVELKLKPNIPEQITEIKIDTQAMITKEDRSLQECLETLKNYQEEENFFSLNNDY